MPFLWSRSSTLSGASSTWRYFWLEVLLLEHHQPEQLPEGLEVFPAAREPVRSAGGGNPDPHFEVFVYLAVQGHAVYISVKGQLGKHRLGGDALIDDPVGQDTDYDPPADRPGVF